jgi:hypothetical protein
MKHKDKLFVTIAVTDNTGKKVAVVKNARYEAGMAQIDKIIDTKYRQAKTPPPPPLVMSMILEG